MEQWNNGRMEQWKDGMMEGWKDGKYAMGNPGLNRP
jgi:hypothetical protein